MSKVRILVVDDEPLNLEIISEYLACEPDIELVMAGDGETAWTALQNTRPGFDLLLLDRMLPALDGLSLLKRLKADPALQHMPVIMQTAASTPEQVGEGLMAGAYYYLTKPYRRDALFSIVRAALRDSRRRNELQEQLNNHIHALQFLEEGVFCVRTIEQAGQLAALVAQACPDPDKVVLGLCELLINAIEHGNLGIDYGEKTRLKMTGDWQGEVHRRAALPENADKTARLVFARGPREIRIEVHDQGPGFDWQTYLELAPERAFDPNGRGIALARMMCFDTLTYQAGGSIAVVTLQSPAQPAKA